MAGVLALSSDLAQRALAQFPVRPRQAAPLRQSDNLTWRVEDEEGRLYLLRVHRSVTAALAGGRQQPAVIRSELDWLAALAESGMEVQRPLRARDGSWVAVVQAPGGPAACTLLSWIAGEPYQPGEAVSPGLIRSIAGLIARLHAQACAWTPPQGFTRPSYDAAYFARLFGGLHAGFETHLIAAEDWVVLRRVVERLLEDIAASQSIPGQWGLIHADLHRGNLLVRGGEVLAIDFSLCGFGSLLFDLSIPLVAGVPAGQRRALIEAYRACRPFGDELLPTLEAYCLAGTLSYCAFQVGNPAQAEWLSARIPRLVREECRKYMSGQPIYFEA